MISSSDMFAASCGLSRRTLWICWLKSSGVAFATSAAPDACWSSSARIITVKLVGLGCLLGVSNLLQNVGRFLCVGERLRKAILFCQEVGHIERVERQTQHVANLTVNRQGLLAVLHRPSVSWRLL